MTTTTATGAVRFTKTQAMRLHKTAMAMGEAAAEACQPEPMSVVRRANAFDPTSPVVERFAPVVGGVCGFAWVVVPGNSSFGRRMTAAGVYRRQFGGGVAFRVRGYGQSYTRKREYAEAYTAVLREAGVNACADGRLD